MYTRNKKPNWFLYIIVLLTILIIYLYVKIKSKPIEVVVSDKEIIRNELIQDQYLCTIDDTSSGQDNLTAGAILQVNNYLYRSSLGDAQNNGVVVTDSQQDFEEITGNKQEENEDCDEYVTLINSLSTYDKYLLAKIVQCETGSQGKDAKIAVATVVLNRVLSEDFPNTVEEVIFENQNGVYQFSPISDGNWYIKEPNEEDFDAIDTLVYLRYKTDALYFESCSNEDNWHSRNLECLFTENSVRFYK